MSLLKGTDYTTLRLLLAAVDEGNLAAAAKRENVAVSAISRRITDFEVRAGCKLLDRHDRGVRPTPAAQPVLDQIRAVQGLLDKIAHDLDALRAGTTGFVRVHAHMSAAGNGLYERVAEFLARHPGVEIQLEEHTSLEVVHAVRVGSCDVGFISGTVETGVIHQIEWGQDELVVLLPLDSSLRAFEALSLSQLAGQPFIGMQRESALLALCRGQATLDGTKLRERSHASSFESVRHMVGAGLGVAVLPESAARPYAEATGFLVRRLTESWAVRPLALCVRDPAECSVAARMLVDFVKTPTASVWSGAREASPQT